MIKFPIIITALLALLFVTSAQASRPVNLPARPSLIREEQARWRAFEQQAHEEARAAAITAVYSKLEKFAQDLNLSVIQFGERKRNDPYGAYLVVQLSNGGACWATGDADRVSNVACDFALPASEPARLKKRAH